MGSNNLLGFKVGEIENGEVGYDIEWMLIRGEHLIINLPKLVISSRSIPNQKKLISTLNF